MREILFRGKGDTRYNDGAWYFGVPIQDADGDWQICTRLSKRVVLPETIGEFIGIHDKNEKPIFDGDIVRAKLFYRGEPERLCIVKYNPYDATFMLMNDNRQYYKTNSTHWIEVLGNIWDNPELLRQENEYENL